MKEKLTEQDFQDAANAIGCEVAVVKAVAEVESGRRGGFCPDDFPTTLFEGHVFHRYTKGVYDNNFPDISYPKWTTQFYGKTWADERARLAAAINIDRRAALMSASWGRFQIMGFNFALVGCTSVQKFVNRNCESERSQGELFVKYVFHAGLAKYLVERRWKSFAEKYNGPLYWKNQYDEKLEAAYLKYGGTVA
jgi:hypothetical protein